MANTIASALTPAVVRDRTVTVLQSKLAFLKAFSMDFGTDILAPNKVVQVPKATAGATGQTNATNFESGDSTLSNIAVTPAQLSVSFHLTSAQINNGIKLQQIIDINLAVLANMIIDAATAPMTDANSGTVTTVAAADFGTDDLIVLWKLAKNFNIRNLVLDGSYLGNLLPTDREKFALGEAGAYGFDGIFMNNRWSGSAIANLAGLVVDPQAYGVASGMAVIDEAVAKQMLVHEIVQLPQLGGLAVQYCQWGSLASRAVWASFDLMFGAAAGDATASHLLVTA